MFKNYYQQMGFAKENNYYSMKHLKKDLQLFTTKLTEKKYVIFAMLKNTSREEKPKTGETIKRLILLI